MELSSLDDAVRRYCDRGIAESTTRTYKSGLNRYLSFCNRFGLSAPFPVSEIILCYFVTSLAQEGIAPATIKIYLAAVRHAQVVRGLPEPRESSTLPRLRLIQRGIRRDRARAGLVSTQRLPITPPILRRLRTVLRQRDLSYDSLLVWAVATVGFFGFFRSGEITVSSLSAYDPSVSLSWGDVAVTADQQVMRVFLRRSKTDQYGRGTEVFLGATGDEICPVEAVRTNVARRGTSPGAFFQLQSGAPLTKAKFVESVRSALTRAGIPQTGYSRHSFRIGAATVAAQAGLPDSTIQALGRWSSPAFLRYIRTPREELARYSNSLARTGGEE